jgi:hypothetical protein
MAKAAQIILPVGAITDRPTPGTLATRVQEALEGEFAPQELAGYYRELMQADRIYYDRHGKEHRAPDHQVRMAALRDYMDRAHGRPPERQLIIHHEEQPSLDGIIKQAQASPVLLDTLIGLLMELKTKGVVAEAG